ncbi:hypothetical protein LQW54_012345 [Pestalotiopsis sp. IQ-011]
MDLDQELHAAIADGDLVRTRLALDGGADVLSRSEFEPHFTPLLQSAQNGNREIAHLLWQRVGPSNAYHDTRRRLSCLEVAARNGHAALVGDFLDVWNWGNDEKGRALSDAAGRWCDNVVELLLDKISYDQTDIQGALHFAVALKTLLPEIPEKDKYCDADYVVQERLVKRLIEAGANPNTRAHGHGESLLHHAVRAVDLVGAAKALLDKGADPNSKDAEDRTPLHCSFFQGPSPVRYGRFYPSAAIMELLLVHEASPDSPDRTGESPLHTVAHVANLESFQSYLSHCANPQLACKSSNHHGETVLHYAAAGGKLEIVEFLLNRGLDVDMVSSDGWTPLVCALTPTRGKTLDEAILVAGMLLLRGAAANVRTGEGWSPLHCLPDRFGDGNVAQLAQELVARGADDVARFEYSHVLTFDAIRRHNLWGFRMREYVQKCLE